MVSHILKDERDIEDFVRGCTFFGTGGGGDPIDGKTQLLSALHEGKEIKWVDVTDIPDESITVCAYGMGSIAPLTSQQKKEMMELGLTEEKIKDKIAAAIKELEIYTQKKVEVIVPVEIGGANTPTPLAAGARLGLLVPDGDYSGGRAIPEVIQTTPHLYGYKMAPLASVDQWGNIVIIKNAVNNKVAEKLGKLISILSYGRLAGQATYIMTGKEMKKIITSGTLTQAFELGKVIREARDRGKDPIEGILRYTKGWLLFEGKVIRKDDEDKEGYYWGTVTLEGMGDFQGHKFKWWFKNENHISWYDEKVLVTSPDIISVVYLENGEPVPNPRVKVGDEVAVIGVKSKEIFRSKEGLEVLGPAHFGFDIKYKPIEEVLKNQKYGRR